MSNIGIKFKIMIIVIVGLIGLSITSIYTLSSIVKKRSEAEYSEKIVNVIIKQNDFIHEMQKERGLSSGVLSGGDNVKLIEQRKNVDAMLEKLDEKNEIIPELSSIRSNIDQKNSNSAIGQITKILRKEVIAINGYSNKLESNLVDDLKRIIVVGEIKESFGILRATLNGIFTKKSISKEDYNKVVALNSVINKFMQDFDEYNPKEFSEEFDAITRKKADFIDAINIIKNVVATENTSYDAASWFSKISISIDAMREFELKLLDNMQKDAMHIKDEANTQLIVRSFVIVVCILLMLLVSIFVGKNIIRGIDLTKNSLKDFFDFLNNKTNSAHLLNIKGKDEISQMAALIDENIEKIRTAKENENAFIQKANTFVNEIKDGNYEASLEADTNNPALNQLKSTFKDLQLALKNAISSNGKDVLDLLNTYKNQDFTKRLV
ncbi:hypothetical protein HMPREF1019_00923 [Campylobacter sp. 10_1_50]|nr:MULTISPECIES: nitrate- and nitrite sensing domain-containing protein [Campylobacter]EHL90121.1 hypothetical protein HMPREF1019_00923 [Campylobacter sp. 10_1_50]